MNTFEAIETRRSVKHYDPKHRMTDKEIEKLLSAAILSPTSFNIQNWRFVSVVDAQRHSASSSRLAQPSSMPSAI